MALSKKAQQFVGSYKIKAQGGLQFPYIIQQSNPEPLALDTTSMEQGQPLTLGQDLTDPNARYVPPTDQPREKGTVEKVSDALGMLSPALKIGIGVSNFIKGQKEKKVAKFNERLFKEDYQRRKEQMRDSFYATPYTVGRSDDLTMKNGGQLQTVTLYQQGGITDFMDFYTSQESKKRNSLSNLDAFYKQTALNQKNQAQELVNTGLNQAISGVTGIIDTAKKAAGMAAGIPLQKGGIARKALLKKSINKYQQGGLIDSLWNTGADLLTKAYDTLNPTPIPTKVMPVDTVPKDRLYGATNEQIKLDQDLRKQARLNIGETLGSGSGKSKSKERFREKQEGGEIDEDLYSETFNPGYDNSSDSFNDLIEAEQTQMMKDQAFENDIDWILQDSINRDQSESAETQSSQPDQSSQYTPRTFGNVIDKIGQQESGNNYAAWNETSNTVGKYQFMEKYWADEIKNFMGLPPQLTSRQVMKAFQNSPKSQDAFMNYVVETKYKPVLPEMRQLGKQYGFTDDDLIKLLHYRGISDTRRRLKTGDFKVSISEKKIYQNPDILEYLRK